ncbi:MAG: hypothetical protein PF501_09130 [Salinisphaera sp.]|nr:hypothetical protein [Salinisphaera sp.]
MTSAPAGATAADSVTVAGGNIFVGFGNNNLPTGADGKSSTIVKYNRSGVLIGSTRVVGHNDGLRYTGNIWSLQNEDANPNLVLINPANLTQSRPFSIPNPHGGGYDDVAFTNGRAFITASAPPNDPNTKPALISASLPTTGSTLNITSVLQGNASVRNQLTTQTETLNLQDPDGIDSSG